ncbi:MAG: type I DNA topoisomerase, partial [Patescibacteria group bacterium]
MSKLVIVESPTKAKTISNYLGKEYIVQSSFGHIRDLPKGKFGVDVEHDFEPNYVIPTKSRKTVTALKKSAKKAEEVLFATDEDREGEAISWHLAKLLDVPEDKAQRIVFHEITPEAISAALEHPRHINQALVDAQQARRILDRLVGYELSPFLWRKITKGLSAGRVQSVALRLIVEREREIEAFNPREYWTLEATFSPSEGVTFIARLYKRDQTTLDKFAIANAEQAQQILDSLASSTYRILDVVKKETKRSAPAPFTTSTLQQEANKRLHFSTKQTMMIAQQLYEGVKAERGMEGLITYMRTDSVNLSERFTSDAFSAIKNLFGDRYAVGPGTYVTKSKLAQEAHEAIRPTSPSRTPESLQHFLTDQQYRLYDLIWRRALA